MYGDDNLKIALAAALAIIVLRLDECFVIGLVAFEVAVLLDGYSEDSWTKRFLKPSRMEIHCRPKADGTCRFFINFFADKGIPTSLARQDVIAETLTYVQ